MGVPLTHPHVPNRQRPLGWDCSAKIHRPAGAERRVEESGNLSGRPCPSPPSEPPSSSSAWPEGDSWACPQGWDSAGVGAAPRSPWA